MKRHNNSREVIRYEKSKKMKHSAPNFTHEEKEEKEEKEEEEEQEEEKQEGGNGNKKRSTAKEQRE